MNVPELPDMPNIAVHTNAVSVSYSGVASHY